MLDVVDDTAGVGPSVDDRLRADGLAGMRERAALRTAARRGPLPTAAGGSVVRPRGSSAGAAVS